MNNKKTLIVSHAPFWHNGSRISERSYHTMLAALPAVLVGLLRFGIPALGVVALAVSTAILWELGINRMMHQRPTVGDGNAALIGLLLAMLMPATAPWWTRCSRSASAAACSCSSSTTSRPIPRISASSLAQAVERLFPDCQVTIGPVIEDGFYYDFATGHTFTPEDLEKIESRMREIVARSIGLDPRKRQRKPSATEQAA